MSDNYIDKQLLTEAAMILIRGDFLMGKWKSFYIDGKEYALKIEERK